MPRNRGTENTLARLFTKPLQGTLNLLILKALRRGHTHGYGITNLIQEASEDVLEVEEGSLYPALHKMEHEGWLYTLRRASDLLNDR